MANANARIGEKGCFWAGLLMRQGKPVIIVNGQGEPTPFTGKPTIAALERRLAGEPGSKAYILERFNVSIADEGLAIWYDPLTGESLATGPRPPSLSLLFLFFFFFFSFFSLAR